MILPAGTIDLGELPRGGPAEVAAPWPVLARLARRHDRRRAIRLAGATAATVLVLLTLTAAAGPARPAFVPKLTVQAAAFHYDREYLYVIEPAGDGDGDARLVAYRLADGSQRWTSPVDPPSLATIDSLRSERVLLVTSRADPQGTHTAYDADTGRRLWQRDRGFPTSGEGGYYLFQGEPAGDPPQQRFTAVEPRTGEPVWSESITALGHRLGRTHLVVQEAETLASYRLATGERSATIPLPHGPSTDLQLTGSLVVVVDRTDRHPVVTGYDVDSLRPQWTVTDLAGQILTGFSDRCGELLCLAGDPPRAIDPATGQTVWSADWLPVDRSVDDPWYVVTDPELPELAGRLLLADISGRRLDEPPPSWLVDAGTGEPVLDLAGWQLGPGWGWSAAGAPTPLLVRPTDQAAAVGRIRPDLSGVRLVGVIDAAWSSRASWCTGLVERVLCFAPSTTSGEEPLGVTLWQHR